MQRNLKTDSDCSLMDECLLRCGHVLDRLAGYKINSADLNDFAENIAASFEDEVLNGNFFSDLEHEPSSFANWQTCPRLQPEDSHNFFLSAGYNDCMDEAIRFLIEEEDMGPEHPVVRNLKSHLEQAKDRVLSSIPEETDSENNNLNVIPSHSSDVANDCYMAIDLLDSSLICSSS